MITDCIENGKDWIRQVVKVEEWRPQQAEVKAISSSQNWGWAQGHSHLLSDHKGGFSTTWERRSQNDKESCWPLGGGDVEVLPPLSPQHE